MTTTSKLHFEAITWNYPNMRIARYFGVPYALTVRLSELHEAAPIRDIINTAEGLIEETGDAKLMQIYTMVQNAKYAEELRRIHQQRKDAGVMPNEYLQHPRHVPETPKVLKKQRGTAHDHPAE